MRLLLGNGGSIPICIFYFSLAWMLCCIIFVFGSLLAYAGLLYAKYWKKPKDPERKRAKQTQSTNSVGHGIMTKSTNDYFGGNSKID